MLRCNGNFAPHHQIYRRFVAFRRESRPIDAWRPLRRGAPLVVSAKISYSRANCREYCVLTVDQEMTESDAAAPKVSRLKRISAGVGRLTRAKQRFPMPAGRENLRVMIATDAWKPQVNGVVRTLETLGDVLEAHGNEVRYITPDAFVSVPMPSYSEIRLSLLPNRKAAKMINEFKPDAIHIATEGPIGRAARRFCKRRGYPFTTSFHTRFAEYAAARWAGCRFPGATRSCATSTKTARP